MKSNLKRVLHRSKQTDLWRNQPEPNVHKLKTHTRSERNPRRVIPNTKRLENVVDTNRPNTSSGSSMIDLLIATMVIKS